jgi:hypothetical protein
VLLESESVVCKLVKVAELDIGRGGTHTSGIPRLLPSSTGGHFTVGRLL